ncbi:MAG: AGE family epimerase/isomerase [Lachnospiraceae bacterium]|nr:AGE family epimerase/isomerase [Lachnospiraceae bacterium]
MSKYQLNTEDNRAFMKQCREELLAFGRRFPSPGGSSYYLGDDGTPWTERPRETWITSRMAHVYAIGAMLGCEGAAELSASAIRGLRGELHDDAAGGWYAGLTADGQILPDKQCYAHAFVILAASSGVLAGIEGADALLKDALQVYEERFWDEQEGLAKDTWNTEFTTCSSYRGLNANMHSVEALLAAADVTGEELYRERAGRIIRRVLTFTQAYEDRIPEHYSEDWKPLAEFNAEKKDDPFKPYGATPGHGIEWARLIVQWALSSYPGAETGDGGESDCAVSEEAQPFIDAAQRLYQRAVKDAWNADGAPGLVYTTDWTGAPIVHDRMHWTLAEAINTSAVLFRVTGKARYAEDYEAFLQYLDACVLDHKNGSWFHQLDRNNQVIGTVWPGKSDLYHAFQATLIPYGPVNLSIAPGVKRQN